MENLSHLFGKILHLDNSSNDSNELPAILSEHNLEGIAEYIQKGKCSNIIVLTGAGISTAAGIPDFRSPGSGLYHNLKEYKLPYPEAVFAISFFKENPEPFFKLARILWPEELKPTLAHYFIRLLHEKKLLLRNYTQNIDTLEFLAGIPPQLTVEAHGSFRTGHCTKCNHEVDYDWLKDKIFNGPRKTSDITSRPGDPEADYATKISQATTSTTSNTDPLKSDGELNITAKDFLENSGKRRSSRISKVSQPQQQHSTKSDMSATSTTTPIIPLCPKCRGVVKPDIVFFGESLPSRFFTSVRHDFPLCDLLIIMGTSLIVQPFASLVDYVSPKTPRLLINKERTSSHASIFRFLGFNKGMDFDSHTKNSRDVFWKGTCDEGCKELAKLLGWEEDLKRIMDEDVPTTLNSKKI